MPFNMFPYSNFSDLNINWILDQMKNMSQELKHLAGNVSRMISLPAATAADDGKYLKCISEQWVAADVDIPEVPDPATNNPLMDGTVSIGTSLKYARADHKHPSDSAKLGRNQGSANAGKFLVVGNNGYVTLLTLTEWQGGNY